MDRLTVSQCVALAMAVLAFLPPRVAARSLAAGEWALDGNSRRGSLDCPIGAGLVFGDRRPRPAMVDEMAAYAVLESGSRLEYIRLKDILIPYCKEPFSVGIANITVDEVKASLQAAVEQSVLLPLS